MSNRTSPNRLALAVLRREVAALYLQGLSQRQIAEKLDRAQPTISRQLRAIREEWTASAVHDVEQRRATELARLDKLMGEGWAAWERSCAPLPPGEDGKPNPVARVGNPKLLDVLVRILDQRNKILGVYAPVKVSPTDPDGLPMFKSFVGIRVEDV